MFRTIDNRGSILTRVKDPTSPDERRVRLHVYEEICVRGTKINLVTRIKEHKAACRLAALKDLLLPSRHGRRAMKSTGMM